MRPRHSRSVYATMDAKGVVPHFGFALSRALLDGNGFHDKGRILIPTREHKYVYRSRDDQCDLHAMVSRVVR